MKIQLPLEVLTGKDEGLRPLFLFQEELQNLPQICEKCHRNLVDVNNVCIHCYIEDEPDFDLIFRDDK